MAEAMTAAESMAAVMDRVRAVAKNDRNQHFGFNFRGIDAVVNAVGPALRDFGVVIIPEVKAVDRQSNGKATSTVVTVAYHWHGPDGSVLTGTVIGEAMDSGDKSVPKAMSVAFRTYLLQSLCLPTTEPDPDATSYTEPVHADADRARTELRTLCDTLGVDPQWAVAEFRERTQEELPSTPRADLIREFMAALREQVGKGNNVSA